MTVTLAYLPNYKGGVYKVGLDFGIVEFGVTVSEARLALLRTLDHWFKYTPAPQFTEARRLLEKLV